MKGGRVAALAGRRIDAPNTKDVRFPLDHVRDVEQQLRKSFIDDGISELICSAACGADLLALKAAASLGLVRRIVLPFGPERFLQTSVLDRPGDWRDLYDQQIDEARVRQQLIILQGSENDANAYSAATDRLVEEAQAEAGTAGKFAYVVWEGNARSSGDETANFRQRCEKTGFELREINTLAG